VKKAALALALVVFALLGVRSLFASDSSLPSDAGLPSRNASAVLATVPSAVAGSPAEEAAVLAFNGDSDAHRPSLFTSAEAGVLLKSPPHSPADEPPVPLTTGAWLIGIGLMVFVISRKRFRS
jgi:hypothetical protein